MFTGRQRKLFLRLQVNIYEAQHVTEIKLLSGVAAVLESIGTSEAVATARLQQRALMGVRNHVFHKAE